MKFMFLLFCFISFAFAKSESFDLNDQKKMTLNLPAGWEGVKDLYGIPVIVLGPWENESRPAMSFVYTGMKESKFPRSELQKLFVDFQSEKQKWVDQHKGKLISYEATTPVKFANSSGHFIGAQFNINGVHFIERSYYLTCLGEVYNLKYSIRKEHEKYLSTLSDLVETFQCK